MHTTATICIPVKFHSTRRYYMAFSDYMAFSVYSKRNGKPISNSCGLVVEIFFVKYCTKIKWLKAIAVAFLMNLVTSMVGLYTNTFSGLFLELILNYVDYHSPTFNWDHWILHYTTIIFINTLIEGVVVRLTLKLKLKNTFWWLFLANTISVMLCAIYIHFVHIRL